MATNLSCRMYQPLYPEANRLVMGKVKSIVNNEAVVSLLEFEEKDAKIFNSEERDLVVGRTMPFRVLDGNENAIVLNPNPLTLEDKWRCDCEYVKARHVHRVLFSVAEDKQMNLETLYTLAGWPTYDQLLNLHVDQAFLGSDVDPNLKEFLLQRIRLMVYVSWRIREPRVLQFCNLVQVLNTSHAFALVRQTEAYLKLKERLAFGTYLSVQDLINKAYRLSLLGPDGSASELAPIARIIVDQGLTLDSDCPMQNSLDGEYTRTDGPVSTIHKARVYIPDILVPIELVAFDIIQRIKTAPIACSVYMYPSYQNNLQDHKIYGPTADEVKTYKSNTGGLDCHTMLCTGHGVDRRGEKFLEFQDSRGNVNTVDQGYVRFAHHHTVADYVYFTDFGSGDFDSH